VCCTVEKVPLKYQYERQLVGFCDRACYLPKTFSSQPRQALSQTHIRNGAAYAATKQHIFERQALMSLLMATVITRRKINIDTEDDLNTYARWLEQQP
jgi:CMP-N-acetylneuraminic acid synthetase